MTQDPEKFEAFFTEIKIKKKIKILFWIQPVKSHRMFRFFEDDLYK